MNKKIKTAGLDAEVLLSFVLKKPKEFLYTHPKYELTKQQITRFKKLISRRSKGEPVAYLRNTKEFYGLDFYINKRVLIPRPETELLVEEVVESLKPRSRTFMVRRLMKGRLRDNTTIIDIGTGSGCIAISLAKHLPKTKILATDISKPALAVAKKNARKQGVKVKFYQGDLLEPLKNKKIDIIAANLPYLDNYYKLSKDPGLKFEPEKALEGFQHGIAVYEKLFKQVAGLKRKPKIIICEIGPTQAKKMKKLAKKYLPNSKVEIKKDLAGLNRVFIIKLPAA